MKNIATDVSTYEDLIKDNYLYVDKTDFIWKLVGRGKGTYFLSRPRRFGKSLLLTTFDAYFSGKKDLFKGLKIEKLAPAKWEVYPIIRLKMDQASNCKTVTELKSKLDEIITENATDYNVTVSGIDAASKFTDLINELYSKTGKSVVILVDEYDKPILDNIFNDNINDILDVIKAFYQVIKTQNAKEQFVFITGVTKFAHTSMFSGMNNPTDLTMDPEFATMLGYTQKELEKYFKEYIPKAAKSNNIKKEELLRELKRKYDGFRFHGKSESIYNPISVGKFFKNNEFKNYWMDTGTPTFLYKAAKNNLLDIEDKRNKFVDELSFDKYEVDNLDPFVFAVQCGYLTIKDSKEENFETLYKFDYPNDEVRDTFSRFLFTSYTNKNNYYEFISSLRNALENGDIDTFVENLNTAFINMSYENIGNIKDNIIFYEGFYRNLLSVIMTMINVKNISERQIINGKIDLVCLIKDTINIFEIKVGNKRNKKSVLLQAMKQAVDKKKYYKGYISAYKHVNIIALVFDKTSKLLIASKLKKIK